MYSLRCSKFFRDLSLDDSYETPFISSANPGMTAWLNVLLFIETIVIVIIIKERHICSQTRRM